MDMLRKIIIISAFMGVIVVGFALKRWIMDDRSDSFKSELRNSLIGLFVFAVIAAAIIYLNN